jgi:hypothetical protein
MMRRIRWATLVALSFAACKKEAPPPPAPATSAPEPAKTSAPEPAKTGAAVPEAPVVDAATKAVVIPEASAARDAAFWTWFKAHRLEVAKVKSADEPIANELAAELHKIDPRLIPELGIGAEPRELIISADGLREAFPAVKRLVAAAPAIPGWKVVAFRPRKGADVTVDLGGGTKLGENDLFFVVLPTAKPPAPIDLLLYVPGIGGPDDKAVKQVAFLLLDATLGEYDVETKVGGIAIKPVGEKPPSAKPLKDLPRVVDAWK